MNTEIGKYITKNRIKNSDNFIGAIKTDTY